MLARGNENFRAPGENRTRDLPNSRSDVLTTEDIRLQLIDLKRDIYLLLTEFEVRTVSYGPSFFLICNLQYGPRRRG